MHTPPAAGRSPHRRRALLAGQTHETTRHYGTVTCMPPELLARGILQPAGDVYRCRARWH